MKNILIFILFYSVYINAFFHFTNPLLIETNINKHRDLYKYCSKLSKDVYNNKAKYTNELYQTHVNILNINNTLYICFRGTSSLRDWKINLDSRLIQQNKNDDIFKVHKGFYTQYNSIKNIITSYIVQNYTYNNIVICGHSLGGALATICAFDLYDNIYNNNITCVTFGSPRVGDKNFVRLYNKYNINTHRIVISGDPVPKWPLNGNYIHICCCMYFKNKKIFIKPNKAYVSIKRFLIYILNCDYNLYSHDMDNYINILDN
jgi:predicted lipase